MISTALRFATAATIGILTMHAGLITTAPANGTTTVFDGGTALAGCHTGPSSGVDAGFTISADSDACFNYSAFWEFGVPGNGFDGSPYFNSWLQPLIGDATGFTTVTIDLHGSYSAVGGYIDYTDPYDTQDPVLGPAVITALAADGHTVLQSYNLETDAPFYGDIDLNYMELNQGDFRGITDPAGGIAFFQISGANIAMHDITLVSGVPEPSTLGLFAVAAGLLLGIRRRS